jgi:hypothetical protein
MVKRNRGGRRPGAGAKPKPVDERRDKRVMLSLTAEEYARLRRFAGHQPVAVFARERLLATLNRPR